MTLRTVSPGGLAGLAAPEQMRLSARLEAALARARRLGRPVLAALTLRVDGRLDPTAVVLSSRQGSEPWFCLEQPERDAVALASLGCVAELQGQGAGRFTEVAQRWRALLADALVDPPDGPTGAGAIAVGGFAFAPDGGRTPAWRGFPPASLLVPELALARRHGEVRLTLSALVGPDDVAEEVRGRLERRLGTLQQRPLPLLDPAPARPAHVSGVTPPEHYEAAVARAVERIRAGEIEKVVLAREVQVQSFAVHDPAAILGVLREAFPGCMCLGVGRGEAALVAATPELLIRREGLRASTMALAGSTRRSADPAVDDHLGEQLLRSAKDREEQAIVIRRIEHTLRPHAVWVTSAPEPIVARMANIQHLATPIRAQLSRPIGAVELAGMLHPTPAVGGEPFARATSLIPALEGMDRGWYAGPVGWTDTNEDGEFCVALRCALLRGGLARCYAGVGVVRDSDPRAELAETEIKLAALLPLLAG
ncbi:MAG TPA: isochorismate synthase [Solirubrobacteraceae bacterium]|jgi:salicylate biosynthesis isochorismate synthase/menaquinone-specific isochorismate synthase|nr:isochorismate synthase [Solirubrobacteraceae bacterium]